VKQDTRSDTLINGCHSQKREKEMNKKKKSSLLWISHYYDPLNDGNGLVNSSDDKENGQILLLTRDDVA
jgi:hypothetical protein